MTQTLLHVLAAEPPQGDSVLTRCTVRAGSVRAGDCLCFASPNGTQRNLEVRSVVDSLRWSTIVFSGHPDDLRELATGAYVRTRSPGRPTPVPFPEVGAAHGAGS